MACDSSGVAKMGCGRNKKALMVNIRALLVGMRFER